MVVFEGGLKRGPNPEDTYCDEVDLAPYLKKGKNQVAVLVWYFGKHKDMRLLQAGWHYMALTAASKMARLLGN